jgi:hypothetical protein
VERYISFWSGAYTGRGRGYPGGEADYPDGEEDILVRLVISWRSGGYLGGKDLSVQSGEYPNGEEDG